MLCHVPGTTVLHIDMHTSVGSSYIANLLCLDFIFCVFINFIYAFSALTLLVGRQEGHPACKKLSGGVHMHGYLPDVRCRFAYGLADVTATYCLLLE